VIQVKRRKMILEREKNTMVTELKERKALLVLLGLV